MTPHDFGPIYAETTMGRFPVEPWNTFSNAGFLILILYLVLKTRLNLSRYPVIVLGLPILTVGFVGGTIYHATRSDRIWLIMDFMPILILSLIAGFHFWREVTGGYVHATIALLLFFVLSRLIWLFPFVALSVRINTGYAGLALSLLMPAFLLCWREKWRDGKLLIGALAMFICAITFRAIDSGLGARLLPMGTHFLWHIFGAGSAFLMFEYLLRRYGRKIIETN